MRILLLGTGYVGEKLLEKWSRSNDRFIAITTKAEKLKRLTNYHLCQKALLCRFEEEEKLAEQVLDCQAAIVTIAPQRKRSYKDCYLACAKVMQKLLAKRQDFYLLYTSSTSVYAEENGGLCKEDSPLHTEKENPALLKEAEEIFLSIPNTCVLRLAGIYGPGRDLEKRAEFMSGRQMPGNGSESTNHIHQADILAAIEHCFEKKLNGVYNLANDPHPSRKALYEGLTKRLAIAPPLWSETKQAHKVVSNEKEQKNILYVHTDYILKFGLRSICSFLDLRSN